MCSCTGTQYGQDPKAAYGNTAPAYFVGVAKLASLKTPERRKQ